MENKQIVLDWIANSSHSWAQKMAESLNRWGSLSAKQLEASARIMEQANQPKPEALQAQVDVSPIEAAFTRAHNQGIKRPRMGFSNLIFSRAPDSGKNAGAIYIKSRGADGEAGAYLGKVMNGTMTATRDCTTEQIEDIQRVLADPKKAAQAYGQEFGICCICSRLLTDETSIANGIGPICAERFGWN